ncbi:MAG: hypothetical protein ACFFDF_12940 [Candidatus Odinarchaeota archaeon]
MGLVSEKVSSNDKEIEKTFANPDKDFDIIGSSIADRFMRHCIAHFLSNIFFDEKYAKVVQEVKRIELSQIRANIRLHFYHFITCITSDEKYIRIVQELKTIDPSQVEIYLILKEISAIKSIKEKGVRNVKSR